MTTKTTFHSSDDHRLVEVAASELTPLMIDWLVARIEGVAVGFDGMHIRVEPAPNEYGPIFAPSTDPARGHYLLEREKIQCRYIESPGHKFDGLWFAQDCRFRPTEKEVCWTAYGSTYPELDLGYLAGPTMLIAGLRFIIAKKIVGKASNPTVFVPAQLATTRKKRTRKAK